MNKIIHKIQHLPLWRLRAHKFIGAGAIIFDPDGKILLLKSRLRGTWENPAGGSEGRESPLATCRREVAEEVGLKLKPHEFTMIGVDYHDKQSSNGFIMFTFAAHVDGATANQIKLQRLEATDIGWFERNEAVNTIAPTLQDRFRELLDASDNGRIVYMHGGNSAKVFETV